MPEHAPPADEQLVDDLRDTYAQDEADHDRTPSEPDFVVWLAQRAVRAEADRDQARAEADDLRRQLDRMITDSADHYQQIITAARCAPPDSTSDYWRWNGQAQVLRETANELARIAGIGAPDWEGIKAAVPADGVYRTAPVPDAPAPAPEDLADRLAQAIGDPGSVVGPRQLGWRDGGDDGPVETFEHWAARAVLAVIAETPDPPAVDPAAGPTAPPEGERTAGDDHGPQEAAQPDGDTWRYADSDGDGIEIEPRVSGPGWLITAYPDGVYLPLDAAASLHAWLGQQLGQPAASPAPDGPMPGRP
jgi:hypothetical protein